MRVKVKPGNSLEVGERTKDGIRVVKHGPGAVVTLDDKEAKRLIDGGVVEQAGKEPEPNTLADPDVIPEGFPGAEALAKAGITTFTALYEVEDLTSIDGIGVATAKRIEAALDELETE